MSTEPITIGTNVLLATATVGIAHTDDGTDLGRLLREADAAMYSAKDAGRERAAWFDQRLHVQALHRMQVEQELRIALTGGDQMLSHYQPAFDLVHGGALHVEALARWRHPRRGLVPPAGFIGVAEETGLITSIGEVILAQAVAQAGQWLDVPDLRVWVNVSPRQLAVPGLRDMLALHLGRAGVPPERFGIEVTESVMAERGRFTSELEAVHDLGVAIAIDDFGTGYSSLARLSTTPFDVIKIDRSFVAQLGTPTGDALVTGIVTLAHSIGAHVIAEGVETAAQLHQVAASGCDAAAGYFMARPGSAEAVPLSIEIGERGLGAQERLVERPDDTVGARFVNRLR